MTAGTTWSSRWAPLVAALALAATQGCWNGSGSDGAVDNTRTVGPQGGRIAFPNGVVLDIPPGAVPEETEIEVTNVQHEQVDAILVAQGSASHEIRCLGGFSGKPDGLEFRLPVTATVPLLPLEPGEIPIQLKLNLEEQTYRLAPTRFRFTGEEGLAEMEILGFSENAVGGARLDEAAEWTVPPPPCCSEGVIEPTCCCFWNAESVSEYSGLFSSVGQPGDPTECTMAAMEVTTTFSECPGQPRQVSWVEERTEDCPDDLTCVIDVHPEVINLFVCEEATLGSTIACETGDGSAVPFSDSTFVPFWNSTNESAATVDPRDGTVRGISEGIAEVEAAWGVPDPNFTPGQAVVNVRSNVRTFSLAPTSATIRVHDGIILEASGTDAEGNPLDASSVTWSSSNPDIAYVTQETGPWTSVEGVDGGTVIITAEYQVDCETVLATARVTVDCLPATFAVDPNQATIRAGDGRILEARLLDDQGDPLDASGVTWSSNNPGIAYVTQDTGPWTSAEGVSEGTVTVTATYDDGCQTLPATANITVECVPVTFSLEPGQATIHAGDGRILETRLIDDQGAPLDASGVTWSSNDPGTAYVTQNTGPWTSVEGVTEGTVTVTATYNDGCQTRSATANVTVECVPVTFSIEPGQATIHAGDGRILEARLLDHQGDPLDASDVTWSSDDPNTAYVTQETGPWTSVEGVVGGTVTITATYNDDCQILDETAAITVEELVVSLVPSARTIPLEDSFTLDVRVTDLSGTPIPGGCSEPIEWTLPAGEIIAFDPDTLTVTGIQPGGPVTITASCEGQSGSAAVEVLDDLQLVVEPPVACLSVGDTLQMEATVLDWEGTPQVDGIYSWSSSDSGVISVDPITGLATAAAAGSAEITVTATTTEGETLLTIAEAYAGHMSIDPRHHELGLHGGLQLRATLLDFEDGTPVLEITPHTIPWELGRPSGVIFIPYADPNFVPYLEDPTGYPYSSPDVSYNLITWSSTDEVVATVNRYGHVHGASEGEAVIMATALPGSDVEQTTCATIRVSDGTVLNSVARFDGQAHPCTYDPPAPAGTPHPFWLEIEYDHDALVHSVMAGRSRGFVVLPAETAIGGIHNPVGLDYSFPADAMRVRLSSGFKIMLWQSTLSNECGGHRYVGLEHTGFDGWFPVYSWYLFENFLDAPAGWHLQNGACVDGDCSFGATDNPEWDPAPTPYWWQDYDWLWEW